MSCPRCNDIGTYIDVCPSCNGKGCIDTGHCMGSCGRCHDMGQVVVQCTYCMTHTGPFITSK